MGLITKTTGIGVGVGSIITAIGIIAFFLSIGLQSETINETLSITEDSVYAFNAPTGAHEILNITGNAFYLKIETPTGENEPSQSLQVDDEFLKEKSLDWFGLVDGQHKVTIRNTGDSDVIIKGVFEFTNDPILFTFHVLVIIAGIVIIGVSAGFSAKKPRGF